jgi:hypothetical protein
MNERTSYTYFLYLYLPSCLAYYLHRLSAERVCSLKY